MYNFLYHVPSAIWFVLGSGLTIFDMYELIMFLFGKNMEKKENKKKFMVILLLSAIICFMLYPVKDNLVEVPKVTPNTYANAIQLLDSYGIRYESNGEVSDYTQTIVNDQSIKEGKIINKKKTIIMLYIDGVDITQITTQAKTSDSISFAYNTTSNTESQGTESIQQIPIPNVIGKTESDARYWLAKRGLTYTIIECETNPNKVDNSFSYSIVSKQFPEPKTYVENNSNVELHMDECMYYIETKDEKMEESSDLLKELSIECGKLVIHDTNNCTGYIYNNFLNENYIGKVDGDSKIIGWEININTGYDNMSLAVSLEPGDEDYTHILKGSVIYNNRGSFYDDVNSYIINDQIVIQINSDNLPFSLNDVQEIEIRNIWKEI